MGQYYKAILLDKNTKEKIIGWVSSYEYKSGAKLMEHSWIKNTFVKSVESLIYNNPLPIVWSGDYADNELNNEENLYSLAETITEFKPEKELESKYSRYVINHDTYEYVDKYLIPNIDGWKIHPLPLLTCEGNGRGGGDFRGESELIGSWARCIISVSEKKPVGFNKLDFNLKED